MDLQRPHHGTATLVRRPSTTSGQAVTDSNATLFAIAYCPGRRQEIFNGGDDAPGLFDKGPAVFCRLGSACGAFEQFDSKPMFQLHDSPTQCGLLDIERGRRPREALCVCGHNRISQLANFYAHVLPRLHSPAGNSRG